MQIYHAGQWPRQTALDTAWENENHCIFENGARALSKEIRKAKKINDTSLCEDLAARLTSVSASTGYTLAWEAFADTDANPGPSIVGGLLGSVGIEDPWRKIKAVPPGGLGDLDLFLTSSIEMHNECAHSGNTTSPPTASDLRRYGQNFAGLGMAIVVVPRGKARQAGRSLSSSLLNCLGPLLQWTEWWVRLLRLDCLLCENFKTYLTCRSRGSRLLPLDLVCATPLYLCRLASRSLSANSS